MDPAALEIVRYPDPILRRTAKPLAEIDDAVRAKARRMIELMHRDKGVGLAAPQVGWSTRLFVMNPTGKPEDDRILVNPVVAAKSKERATSNEGCLSIPDVNGKIERHFKIRLEAYDLEGNEVKQELEGFPARVAQHEIDHLDGILIIDKMGPAEKTVAKAILRDLEAEFHERERARARAS